MLGYNVIGIKDVDEVSNIDVGVIMIFVEVVFCYSCMEDCVYGFLFYVDCGYWSIFWCWWLFICIFIVFWGVRLKFFLEIFVVK